MWWVLPPCGSAYVVVFQRLVAQSPLPYDVMHHEPPPQRQVCGQGVVVDPLNPGVPVGRHALSAMADTLGMDVPDLSSPPLAVRVEELQGGKLKVGNLPLVTHLELGR